MLSFIVNIIIRDRILHRKMKFYTDIKQVLILTLLLSITSEIYFKYNNLINVLWFILCILITGYSFQEYIVRILSVITQFIMKRRGYTTVADGINYNNEMKRFEMIELYKEKSNCCGCSACMNICPKKAITMKPDQDGYLFPDIKDDLCVKCGLCKKVCAFQKPLDKVNRDEPIATYAAINRDKSILSSSTSGGVFSALASIVFEKNGVVFGCAFDRNMEARHICIENPVNLKKLQGSKYVQSNIGTAYIKAKNFLQEGRWVLFTGTPCQIAGFKAYLGKDYPNLITADFVCHGVPSLSFFKGYIKYLEDTLNGKIINFKFRDKIYGWGVTGKVINQKNGTMNKKIILPITSYYFNYFLKGDISRESCYECKYACGIRSADFTMGDYWGIEKAHPDIKTKNGVSLLLINSEKGLQYINKLKQFMVLKQSTFKQAKEYNIQLNHPIEKSEKRDKILQLWREGGSRAVAEDYYKENKMQIKLALMKSMIPLPVRNTVKKYINKENAEKTKAYLYKKTLNHLRLTNKHGK
jgi:coenzyme F420-reducing hydrogenase beta subunit